MFTPYFIYTLYYPECINLNLNIIMHSQDTQKKYFTFHLKDNRALSQIFNLLCFSHQSGSGGLN